MNTSLERRPHYIPPQPQALVHRIPAEILIKIIHLIVPSKTNKTPYHFSTFTHVCRLWRSTFIDYPRAWTTVPATNKECRGFVEMCLERSGNLPLDVRVVVWDPVRNRDGCTCDKDSQGRLLPNGANPCECHFVFEALAETKHTSHITVLNVNFETFHDTAPPSDNTPITLKSCRFFASSFPQLADLTWNNNYGDRYGQLLQRQTFPRILCSLDFRGPWDDPFPQIRGLTSLTLHRGYTPEAIRVFLLENQSLESLSLALDRVHASAGPPVKLPKLRFLGLDSLGPECRFPDYLHIPEMRSLTSLQVFFILDQGYPSRTVSRAIGGSGFTFSLTCGAWAIEEPWETFTGHARPTIKHIHVGDGTTWINRGGKFVVPLLDAYAHTLEVELIYTHTTGWHYDTFWNRVKRAGLQLKTIRFEVSENMDPFHSRMDDPDKDNQVFSRIEDLVKYRFEQGRPFAVVERLVVSEDERVNRLQAHAWNSFYNSRGIGRYVVPV